LRKLACYPLADSLHTISSLPAQAGSRYSTPPSAGVNIHHCVILKFMKTKSKATTKGFHALVWQEDDLYVAKTIEIELASQGKTKKEALKNLEEAIELYFQDEPKPLFNVNSLQNLTFEHITPRYPTYA